MVYSTLFWPWFVLFISCELFNDTQQMPLGCVDPMAIGNLTLTLPNRTYSTLDDNLTYLCKVVALWEKEEPMVEDFQFILWNEKDNNIIFSFPNNGIQFDFMSGKTFRLIVWNRASKDILEGKFQNLDDFKSFYSMVHQQSKYSPQDFKIIMLQRYIEGDYTLSNYQYNDHPLDTILTQPAIFSQYSIDEDAFGEPKTFVIEGVDEAGDQQWYLTFQPNKFKSTRLPIGSQVILTRSGNENEYFIIRLDTCDNAILFADYIYQFAEFDPSNLGLMVSHPLLKSLCEFEICADLSELDSWRLE